MQVFLGDGLIFQGMEIDAQQVYLIMRQDNPRFALCFTRDQLLHLHERAAPLDLRAEADAIYDGTRFSAKRAYKNGLIIGVALLDRQSLGDGGLLFSSNEWELFLRALDAICAREPAS